MSFVVYDLIFLVLFTLATVVFLYKRRHKLQRQGILYLYRTKVGLRVIEFVSKKYANILRPLQYVILVSGYALMVACIWMIVKLTYYYTVYSWFVKAIKIPPIIPLVPYLPNLFKVDYLPPLYFTYWILIIAIIAVSHEFAHGIFARLNNIRVKSTGFGFLGPFLAAFVEPDEKQMGKASKFAQLSILAAGTFANVVMTILFGLIMWLFFVYSFSAAGVNFNAYGTAAINVGDIDSVNGILFSDFDNLVLNDSLARVAVDDDVYLAPGTNLKKAVENKAVSIVVYENAPAVQMGLKGPIVSIDGVQTKNIQELSNELLKHNPGEIVEIGTIEDNKLEIKSIELGEREGKAYLGIGINKPSRKGVSGWFYGLIEKIKDPAVYYSPTWGGDFAWFVYYLLWWIVLINLSVALMNMLPVGIFDGGRFFYLSVWGITGKEKIGRVAFKISTWFFLAIAVWLMVRWAFAYI